MTPDELSVLREIDRIEREAADAAHVHAAAAEWWTRITYLVGIPAALLTIIAGSALFMRLPAPTLAAIVALVAAGLTLLLTILAPRDKTTSYKQAATRFHALRNDASVAKNARPYVAKGESPNATLSELARRYNDLTVDAPLLSVWARARFKSDDSSASASVSSVRSLSGVTEVYDYLAERIGESARTIDDITWGSRREYRSTDEVDAYQRYVKSMKKACERNDVVYREISTLSSKEYLERALYLTSAYGYHLAYYDTTQCKLPLMSFIMLDRREVVFAFYRYESESVGTEIYVAVSDPLIVALFGDYFDTLWRGAAILKKGSVLEREKLAPLAARFGLTLPP